MSTEVGRVSEVVSCNTDAKPLYGASRSHTECFTAHTVHAITNVFIKLCCMAKVAVLYDSY